MKVNLTHSLGPHRVFLGIASMREHMNITCNIVHCPRDNHKSVTHLKTFNFSGIGAFKRFYSDKHHHT